MRYSRILAAKTMRIIRINDCAIHETIYSMWISYYHMIETDSTIIKFFYIRFLDYLL